MFVTETQTVTALALVETLETVNKHSQGFLFEKKSRQKKIKKENKSILLSCIYESICLNIEKKKCIC